MVVVVAAAGVQVAAGVRVVVTSRFVTGGVFTCEDRPRIASRPESSGWPATGGSGCVGACRVTVICLPAVSHPTGDDLDRKTGPLALTASPEYVRAERHYHIHSTGVVSRTFLQ